MKLSMQGFFLLNIIWICSFVVFQFLVLCMPKTHNHNMFIMDTLGVRLKTVLFANKLVEDYDFTAFL